MITLSEALSNFSGTTNYVAKYTPTGNVLGISQIFDNGTNVGIGTATPTSKLQIVGIDSTSSNYSLKIDNSASSPLLYVRNDGNVGINYSGGSISGTKLYINGGATALNTYAIRLDGDVSDILNIKNNGNIGIAVNNPNYKLNVFGDVGLEGINTGSYFNFGANQNTYIRAGKTDQDVYIQDNHNGLVGVGTTVVSAKVHIQGTDSTSSNYSLKIDNLANNPLFYVRNDGVILANNLPTSASGLPSGAIWNNGGILNII